MHTVQYMTCQCNALPDGNTMHCNKGWVRLKCFPVMSSTSTLCWSIIYMQAHIQSRTPLLCEWFIPQMLFFFFKPTYIHSTYDNFSQMYCFLTGTCSRMQSYFWSACGWTIWIPISIPTYQQTVQPSKPHVYHWLTYWPILLHAKRSTCQHTTYSTNILAHTYCPAS